MKLRAVFLIAVSTHMWCGVGDAVVDGMGLSRRSRSLVCACVYLCVGGQE